MEVIKNATSSVTTAYSKVIEALRHGGGIKGWLKSYLELAKNQYNNLIFAFKNFSDVNIKLGLYHLERGNYYDARFRFRLVSWFDKNRPELPYYIGRAFYEDAKPARAKSYIDQYIESGDELYLIEALYTRRLINKDTSIDNIPFTITAHFFNILAPVYDVIYLEDDNAPQYLVFNSLNKILNKIGKPIANTTLDLGCGTGIMGFLSRSTKISSEITGVDISEKMFELAKSLKYDKLPVYSQVEHTDATSYLSKLPADKKFDLITCTNVINYISSLQEFFAKAYQALDTSGIFVIVFKINKGEDNAHFDLEIENFNYNPKYVEQLCKNLNFKTLEQDATKLIDGSEGFYMILQK
ncbi:MAG: methyltransferase domain-containing protein [Rickettsiales bacterium]